MSDFETHFKEAENIFNRKKQGDENIEDIQALYNFCNAYNSQNDAGISLTPNQRQRASDLIFRMQNDPYVASVFAEFNENQAGPRH